ncbi:serine protease [Mesorhizobium sp. M0140]|uniref:S1 family peptidase n=1 Tax=Mesorhizobium sp. M0140 TaxID=2956893 RepID=UPI00333944EE
MALKRAEQMFYCATKITTYGKGVPLQNGTGFFYVIHLKADNSRDVQLFVTNKHVLEGADQISISCHRHDGSQQPNPDVGFVPVHIKLVPEAILSHPNPDVDLCAFPMGQALVAMQAAGTPLFYIALDASAIPSDDAWAKLEAVEKIVMVGCPNGLFDEANNMPIIRSGSTATDITTRYKGKNEFLVDLACFPGSSGSPVFVYDPIGGYDRGSDDFQLGRLKSFFVGVLYAGPTMTTTGEIQLSKGSTFSMASMMHLGQVIRATEILAFDEWVKAAYSRGELEGPRRSKPFEE